MISGSSGSEISVSDPKIAAANLPSLSTNCGSKKTFLGSEILAVKFSVFLLNDGLKKWRFSSNFACNQLMQIRIKIKAVRPEITARTISARVKINWLKD